jgi:DNA-binding beta-propeller fold protein YncE
VAVDDNGTVFVADHFNHRISKFTNTGTFITQWGTLGLGAGEFSDLESVAVDRNGNVFAADVDRIQKFTGAGQFVTEWGSLGNGDGQFNAAIGTAVDAQGNVFVTDQGQHVQKFGCP